MCPTTESGRSESEPFVIDNYFLWLFSLEKHQWRILSHRNASATYGCKILQPYEYDANMYEYDGICEWHLKNTSSRSIKDS